MKKPLMSRILILTAVYCAVFFLIVILQFFGKGGFSYSIGAMTISGRYLQAPDTDIEQADQLLSSGVRIFFGGLEFNMDLFLTGIDGDFLPASPEYMTMEENHAQFYLPGGTTLVFTPTETARGPELIINAGFADDAAEITIPIATRRASIFRDDGLIGVMFNGERYFLGRTGEELETLRIVLSRNNPSISHRAVGRGRQRFFDPADYTIAMLNQYESVLANWRNASFNHWNQNASSLQSEDDIVAYLSEALARGNFIAAGNAIPQNFINSPGHSHISAVYIGGMEQAYRSFDAFEQNKTNRITHLLRERSADIFKENNVLDFLFTRNNTALANETIALLQNLDPQRLSIEHCSGILEAYLDFRRWRSAGTNPAERFIDRVHFLISEYIRRDNANDLIYISHNAASNPADSAEFSLRLGMGLLSWAQAAGNAEWEAVSRSLVLSAITSGGIGSGNLYNILNLSGNYPRAVRLSDDGLWAWTISPSVTASTIAGNLNIAVSFPVNLSHFMIIRGVRPFLRLQLYNTNWPSSVYFERYDSSGWVYHPQEQTLVLKMRHRSPVENIFIVYVEPPPPPPPPPPPLPEPEPVLSVGYEENVTEG